MPLANQIYFCSNSRANQSHSPPLILIHGAGGTHLYWPPELRRLPDYRVLAMDLPGHGKSNGHGRQSINEYSDSVMEWLDTLDIYSAVFIGHSMGSAIVMTIALEYPERVLALGLVGAGARLRVSPQFLDGVANEATFYTTVENIVRLSFSPSSSDRLLELASQRMIKTRSSVLHGDFLACDAFDETARISLINQPTLVLCGIDDQMTPMRYSQFLIDHIPNAVMEAVPNAGHMVMLEKPHFVAKVLTNFLSGLSF